MPVAARQLACVGLLIMIIDSPARAEMFQSTPPLGWFEPYLPEELPELQHPAYFNDLDKARAQVFAGRYKLALITLAKAKDTLDPVDAAQVRIRSLTALGRHERVQKLLDATPAFHDEPRLKLDLVRWLDAKGEGAKALDALEDFLRAHPESVVARFELGHLKEKLGDIDGAKAAYEWFVTDPNNFFDKWQMEGPRALGDDAEKITTVGRALDRWASLTGAYKDLPALHQAILDMFVKAYDVIDRSYWPARVASAEYLLSHDNAPEAMKELKAALDANPHDLRALRLAGQIAISNFNFDGAEDVIETLRRVDSDSVAAHLLEARNLLQQRRARDAEPPLGTVVARQPENLEALGLLAAAHALQLRDEETAQILRQVEQLDPDNASAYLEVADQLAAMRQYPRSAAMYQVAIDRAPWWTEPRNNLGLLYTQSGDEDLARSVLEAARVLDPFNLRTTNYLRLLDDLDQFARKETEHFIVFYDAQLDPLIPEYFSDYLENIHDEVCAQFQHTPAVKTYIEVFPTHDAFSVRTTGSPWIGTVGASTGRVLALVSPRKGKNTMGTFNWAQVLRHEFAHTVTLSATENRIPHWMTEGLAVMEERVPLRWEWVPMLYHAVTNKKLFTMDGLTWGFIRPRRPIDRQLAYAQSFWVCQYIEQTYGREAILKMLGEFRAGQRQEDVFPKVIGRNISKFTEEFFAWTDQQVAAWGYDEETSKKYKELRDRGETLVKAKRYVDALEVWQQIARLRPVDALPHQRLAGLYLTSQINDPEKAIEHLTALHQVELKDNRYAKRIGRIYRDLGRAEAATKFALQAVYIDPYDMDAHKLLAEMYEKSGDELGIARERQVIDLLARWQVQHRQPAN